MSKSYTPARASRKHTFTRRNGVKISEWTETEARHPARGRIALQVHGGGSPADYDGTFVRYRGVRVREF